MERIGFVGLGVMGRPMARHLWQAGYPFAVLETGKPAMSEAAAAGARVVTTPKQLAEQSDVIITMLPDAASLEHVVLETEGILEGLAPGSLLVDMSTTKPSLTRQIAAAVRAQGSEALDAPVSGGQVGAEDATLAIMVGGAPSAYERARPILLHMGKNVTLVGEAGAGQIAKAANQIIVGVTIAAVSEALLFAAKAGVDPAQVRTALMGGFASSRILELHGQRMIERKFAPGAKMTLHRKDMDIVLETGRELALALPLSAQVAGLMDAVIANGGSDLDHAALVTAFEKLANGEIGGENRRPD